MGRNNSSDVCLQRNQGNVSFQKENQILFKQLNAAFQLEGFFVSYTFLDVRRINGHFSFFTKSNFNNDKDIAL